MMINKSPTAGATSAAAAAATTTGTTMKAARGKDYGDIDEMLSVEDGVPVPRLADFSKQHEVPGVLPRLLAHFTTSQRPHEVLIKTHAVALAPGDCRVLSGKTRELQGPPSFPYVPGGDACGIVVELPPGNEDDEKSKIPFKVGDRIAARFFEKPNGAMGEYAVVSSLVADVVPDNVSSADAAALASAAPATLLADRIQKGERVLVLGAGGGIGSHLCQLLRLRGASWITGVSKSPDRLLKEPIACNEAIDYTKDDVFGMQKYKDDPFDVVVDLASGGWPRLVRDLEANTTMIVKPANAGGRYITTTPDTPIFEAHSMWRVLSIFLFPPLWRAVVSRTWYRSKLPAYTFGMSLPSDDREHMTRTLTLAGQGKLRAVVDGPPFDFTTKGVRAAFRRLESRHPHGKVVVKVANDDNKVANK